jgi:hypothetical protein
MGGWHTTATHRGGTELRRGKPHLGALDLRLRIAFGVVGSRVTQAAAAAAAAAAAKATDSRVDCATPASISRPRYARIPPATPRCCCRNRRSCARQRHVKVHHIECAHHGRRRTPRLPAARLLAALLLAAQEQLEVVQATQQPQSAALVGSIPRVLRPVPAALRLRL